MRTHRRKSVEGVGKRGVIWKGGGLVGLERPGKGERGVLVALDYRGKGL